MRPSVAEKEPASHVYEIAHGSRRERGRTPLQTPVPLCGLMSGEESHVSRQRRWDYICATISLGRRLLVGSSNLPGRVTRRTASRHDPVSSITNFALLGLASGGVCRAEPVTRPAGALLPHRFTLTSLQLSLAGARNDRRFTFCGTVPVLANGGRYPPPRPVKPGLSSARLNTSQK